MEMSRYFGRMSVTSRSPISTRPGGCGFEAGEDAQRRGLARARGAEQDQKFAGLDLQVQFLQHAHGAKGFLDLVEGNRNAASACHAHTLYPLTAPSSTPLAMKRCRRMAIRITGMIIITMMAHISHQNTPFSPAFLAATMMGMVCTLAWRGIRRTGTRSSSG